MHFEIEASWKPFLEPETQKPYFKEICSQLEQQEQKSVVIFPPRALIFHALNLCPLHKTKVVILGQDPYHNENEAMGLSFSVPSGTKIPPSLRNIYKEIAESMGNVVYNTGDLTEWVKQGVLLLNATLTVEKNRPHSHKNLGWQPFTDKIIQTVSNNTPTCVFLLWGRFAKTKKALIDEKKHLVLESVHPSPLSAYRGFLGCNHFAKTNVFLEQMGKTPIIW